MSTQTSISAPSAASYVQQGIKALQLGDAASARQLLKQALKLDPHNQEAWLWLSGAVSKPDEQRYCLEAVLKLNPQHSVAQRGLAKLNSLATEAMSVSRPEPVFAEPRPEAISRPQAQALPDARERYSIPETQPSVSYNTVNASMPESTLVEADDIAPEELAQIQQTLIDELRQSESHDLHTAARGLDAVVGLTQPDDDAIGMQPNSNILPETQVPNKAGQTIAPKVPQPAIDPVAQDIIAALGKSSTPDEVARMLCYKYGYDWNTAQKMVHKIQSNHARTIARRQSPYMFALSLVALIGGLSILFYFLVLSQAYVEYGQHNIGLFARLVRRIPQVLTGIAMTVGGIFGIVQTIGSLRTKNSDNAPG